MEPETLVANDRDELVNLAIYDYHVAVELGDSPDPDAWAADNPDIAHELTAYFQDLKWLNLLRPSVPNAFSTSWTLIGGADLQPGDVLGDYILLEKLGAGGQGVVWKASPQQARDIVVALKTLRRPALNDLASVSRLRDDAEAIARMRHPNIIRTSYFGEDRGRWFFVMDLMEGGTIADRVETYKADPRSAALLIQKVARAIHHAHQRGVLHRDLKPGNILLTADGEPRVTDFGLSVRLERLEESNKGLAPANPRSPDAMDAEDVSATFTRVGIVGTIPFMSPEMAAGRWSEVLTASDVYGLGAILYAMLTGQAPFPFRDGNAQTLARVVNGDLTSPREFNRKVDRELNAVCLKCLDRNPANRYGSADALANDLRRWLDLRPTLAGGKPSAAREVRFWARRHPLGTTLTGIAAVALWLASLGVSVAELRAENGRDAVRLAGQVDRELRLIRHATQIMAKDPQLRAAFADFPDPAQSGHQQRAIEAFLTAAIEVGNLFGVADGNPFVNVFVLGADGVLLADTLSGSPSIGSNRRVRDYYRVFFTDDDWRPDHVYVARSFESVRDKRYKIAVSTRIWNDRGKLLGILVANFTSGPRLIDVDMRVERNDAAVLCPMDRSDPVRGIEDPGRPWSYIYVLDRRYDVDWGGEPYQADASGLPNFQGDPKLDHDIRGPRGGKLVDYHRVGNTHLVVVTRRNCPWPLSWLPDFR
jgi:eukaryotic-like serine/threonine-protein kinase